MSDARWGERLSSLQRGFLKLAGVGAVLCAFVALFSLEQFLRAYLVGWLFWWGIAVGCLGLVMLHDLTGGRWGENVRPFLIAGAATLPLVALLFLVVAIGAREIYPWAKLDAWAAFPRLQHRYLNQPFFLARAVAYFAIWLGFVGVLCDPPYLRPVALRRRSLASAIGLVVLVVTISFAAIDWAMSLEPEWYSTMFGALTAMGGALAALALAAAGSAVAVSRSQREPSLAQAASFNDVGSMLLAMLMLWAYFAFSQYLIVWSGNLPEDSSWYLRRLTGAAGYLALAIVLLHFAIPFALLLGRKVKQSPRALASIAGLILAAHFVYWFWTVKPAFGTGVWPQMADFIVPPTMGCLWFAAFLWCLPRETRALVDPGNPRNRAVTQVDVLDAPRHSHA